MRHGCCTFKIRDQEREFVNSVNDELCKLLGIQCNITSAYHPQSNGQLRGAVHEKQERQHHKSPTQVAIDESPIPDSEPITISKLPFEDESPTPDPE